MLSEPNRTNWDLNFPLFGIPVRIHPMFWLVSLLLSGLGQRTTEQVLIWVIAVFISILWHEMGHALVIRSFGFRPWITLYGMGGLASYIPTQNIRSVGAQPWGRILISFAGPGAGFLLAAILMGILVATNHRENLHFLPPFHLRPYIVLENDRLQQLLNDIFFLSVFWGLVNLLPIYPLDGGQISRELFNYFNYRDGIRLSLILSMVVAGGFGLYAAVQWKDTFILLFFGFMAYENYLALESSSGARRW